MIVRTEIAKLRMGWYVAILLLIAPFAAKAQALTEPYKKYISTYADECIRQMRTHKIPASITMAQALVESAAGTSRLAVQGRNHFGIKCHKTWQGGRIYANDDHPDECFRKYNDVRDSYTDHSNFLKQPRYSRLFSLRMSDYNGWARGLQQCGYATNKGYANMLIKVIEMYGLYEMDKGRYPIWMKGGKAPSYKPSHKDAPIEITHEGYFSYGLLYVLANEGDTYESIAREMGISLKKLAKYNDVPVDFPLNKGDVVYLEQKNHRATERYRDHVVKVGDSMHSISQVYGIRVKDLYRLNNKTLEYVPEEGDVLRLR